jgi:hypothetical protein
MFRPSHVQFDVGDKHEVMGSALQIELPAPVNSSTTLKVKVFYKTTEGCTALQWLDKEYARIPPHHKLHLIQKKTKADSREKASLPI